MADSRQVPVRSYAVVFLVLVAGVVIVSVAELNLTAGVTAGGCTDPDGNNTYAPGTAKVYSYGRETAYEDRCISNFAVIEYSCKAFYRHATRKYEKRLFSNAYECPFGCYKGACLRQDEGPKCLETDAADFDAYKEGATRVAGGNERWDYCEGNTLVEYSCDAGGQYLGEKRFDCDYGCEFGACLRQPKIVTAQFRASIAGVSDDNKLLKNSLKSGSITGYVRYSHRALAAAPPTAVYDFGDSFHLNLQIDGYGDLSRTEESVGPYPSEGGEAETVATNYVQYRLGTEEDSGGFESGSLEVTDNGESGDAISIGTKGTRPLFWSQSGDTNIVVESIFINLRDESGGAILDSSLPLSFDIDAWKSRDLIIQFASASDPLQKGTIKAAIDWQMRDCIDAENGRDYYRDMDVYQTNFKQEQTISSSAPDSCITGNVLRETYCRSDTYDPDAGSAGVLDSVLYKCPNSCRQVRDENRQSFVNVCVPDQILFDSLSVSPAKAGALQEVNFSSAAYAAENPVKLSCGFSPGAKDACESPDFVFLNPLCSAKVPGAFSGTKKVYCRVVDDAGAASEERSAEFEATAPPPPSFTALLATPSTVSQGQFVTFSATGSSQSGTVKLDCGTSSGAKDACEGAFAGANPSCTKTVPSAWTGAKTVYCRIRDNLGVASGERSVNISVTTAAQNQTGATAFFSVSAISEIVFKGQNISFRGNGNTSVSNMIKLYCGTMPGYSDICEGKFSTKTSSCAAATGSWQTGIGYAYCRISDAQGTVSDDKTARFLVMDPSSVSGIAPKVCIDGNGDGLPDVVQTDSTGRRYCLEAYAAKAFVGEHVPAVIYAWHEDGIKTLSFSSQSIDFVMSSKLCAFAKWCNLTSAVYPQGSPETFVVDASIRSKNGTYIKTQFSVQVACRNPEYCRPNTDFTEFFNWTRSKGYSECITSRYISRTVKPEERAILKGFLLKRPSNITQPYTIHFYDIIPTDENSTYKSLGEGEGGDCRASSTYPDFCPSPVPADYKFIERHFERTFGIDFDFVYHRLDVNYGQEIGQPTLIVYNATFSFYRYPSVYNFQQKLAAPRHSIVHYSIQYLNGKAVGDMSGGAGVAQVSLEPFNVLGIVTYAHEWGHTWGLPHSFYGKPRIPVQLDGIMGNTYIGGSSLLDPTDPLERYAMEPNDGFTDEATFASAYSTILSGDACMYIDVALTDAALVKSDSSSATYELTISNTGDGDEGFFSLAAYDAGENLIENRIVDYIPAGGHFKMNFTASKSNTPSDIVFIIDKENLITGEDEANNRFSAKMP